jgi:hypothetical protein
VKYSKYSEYSCGFTRSSPPNLIHIWELTSEATPSRALSSALGFGLANNHAWGMLPGVRLEVIAALWTASVVAAAACGSTAERETRSSGVPDGYTTSSPSSVGAAPLPSPGEVRERPALPPEAAAELDVFDDPGCPRVVEPIEQHDCDPLLPTQGCNSGRECFPYVDYPSGPCEPEIFGSRCELPGPGVQGDWCDFVGCRGGFLCVASGRGTVCAQLCALPGENTCAPGLICGSVDIKGYGVCF